MKLKERMQKVINQYKDQVDYMEIRLEDTEHLLIEVKNATVDSISNNFIYGGNVRTLYKGGWGFVVFKDLDELENAAKRAVEQARLVGREKSHWSSVEAVDYFQRIDCVNDPRQVSLEEKVRLMKKYTQMALDYDEKLVFARAKYQQIYQNIVFSNSEGSFIDQEKADVYLQVVFSAVQGNDNQSTVLTMGDFRDFNVFYGLEEKVREKCQLVVELLDAPRIKGGKYPVILDPHMTGLFVHEAFGHTVEADHVAGNPEMEKVLKIGKTFGSDILNIYDSGVMDGLRGSYAYDDEGTPAEKTYLLKKGKLVGYLHSRETADRLDGKPTGSARAYSFEYPPIPRMRNTVIEGGDATFEDMMKDVKLGVYAVDSKGGKGGENFSFTCNYGIMIRDGKLAEKVKGFTLAGNLFRTLKQIDMIGNDETVQNQGGGCGKDEQFPLPVTDGGPHIRIQNVTIGGDE